MLACIVFAGYDILIISLTVTTEAYTILDVTELMEVTGSIASAARGKGNLLENIAINSIKWDMLLIMNTGMTFFTQGNQFTILVLPGVKSVNVMLVVNIKYGIIFPYATNLTFMVVSYENPFPFGFPFPP